MLLVQLNGFSMFKNVENMSHLYIIMEFSQLPSSNGKILISILDWIGVL